MKNGRLSLAIIAAAALGARFWILECPFRTDDEWFYTRSHEYLTEFLERTGKFVRGESLPEWRFSNEIFRGNYRPVDWFIKSLEPRRGRMPVPAFAFAINLLIHTATALSAYWIARKFVPPRYATLCGILVAVCPTGAQAHSWLAARGDVWVALFSGLALHISQVERGRSSRDLLIGLGSGLMAAMAFSSKENGLFVIPIILIPVILGLRASSASYLLGTTMTIGIGLVFRYIWLGSWLPVDYRQASSGDVGFASLLQRVRDMLGATTSLVGAFLGSPHEMEHGACQVPEALSGLMIFRKSAPWAAGLLIVLLLARREYRRRTFAMLLSWSCLLLPPLFVWNIERPLDYDRSLLPGVLPFSLVLTLATHRILGANKPLKILGLGAMVVILLGWTHHHIDVQSAHARDAAQVQSLRDLLARRSADPGEAVFVLGSSLASRGILAGDAPDVCGGLLYGNERDLVEVLLNYSAFVVGSGEAGILVLRTIHPEHAFEEVQRIPGNSIRSLPSSAESCEFVLESNFNFTISIILRSPRMRQVPYKILLKSRITDGTELVTEQPILPIRAGDTTFLAITPQDLNGRWTLQGHHRFTIVGPEAGSLTVDAVERGELPMKFLASKASTTQIPLPPFPQGLFLIEVMVVAPEITPVPGFFYWDKKSIDRIGPQLDLSSAVHFSPLGGKDIALAALRAHGKEVGIVVSVVATGGGAMYKGTLLP